MMDTTEVVAEATLETDLHQDTETDNTGVTVTAAIAVVATSTDQRSFARVSASFARREVTWRRTAQSWVDAVHQAVAEWRADVHHPTNTVVTLDRHRPNTTTVVVERTTDAWTTTRHREDGNRHHLAAHPREDPVRHHAVTHPVLAHPTVATTAEEGHGAAAPACNEMNEIERLLKVIDEWNDC